MVAPRATLRGFIVLVIAAASSAPAQTRWLAPLKPVWLDDAGRVRAYCCSESFAAIARSGRDRDAVDSIFAHALRITGGDVGAALLASTVACFDHPVIHLRLGFLTIPIPLSIEGHEQFECARSHLPTKLFFDTPPEGDRDKLQHFFGSAYLQWITGFRTLTTFIGGAIEILEPPFIVGGENDPRDLRADKVGQAFALLIRQHSYVPPSVVLENVR